MRTLTILFLTALSLSANAQKLPNIQQVSLRAPANVKIDGKAMEWGKKLQAYNPAAEIYYAIANDDKKLYLVVQASGGVLTNIINGGVRLAVQKTRERKEAGALFIKYPYLEKGKMVLINPKDLNGGTDTTVMKYNKQLTATAKWIYTKGLNGVDSLLSVYNDRGIAAAGTFDNEMKYTIEMAVDLSLLDLSVENVSKFSYHITVNGEPNRYIPISATSYFKLVTSNGRSIALTEQEKLNVESFDNFSNKMAATTDFWGEYTLVK